MSEEKTVPVPAAETPPKVHKGQGRPPATQKVSGKIIYLGPTLVDGAFVLASNTIYSNGLPPDIAERIKTDPDLAKLFVPVGKAAAVMNKLADENSDFFGINKKVKNNYLNKRKAR